ncbi:glycoside hydrolase family 2 protein [Glycomyces harbinensis]|uniref:Glycosyl hydrolases family 2 n=1 Tax=Glycomyces harbinensis TaxID=58114 RepID=A0A1G7AQZ4_9ACTN|nr:glycoside hydrolase family 2 TIM barrel-domain containing protein [Glycomyces harbinensis]SDE17298.1 Glycosyl hydrolases family 2 [Glycomyces harbinensis]
MNSQSPTFDIRASRQEVARSRPQMLRESFLDLSGRWGFAHDDGDRGLAERWFDGRALPGTIIVPFPPESPASGVGATGFHPVVWYRRELAAADLAEVGHGPGRRLLVHFGAVDYRARVWLDGREVGGHEGGHTPFTIDLTDELDSGGGAEDRPLVLVVRAEDDPHDTAQPRGKQDWHETPHSIWYHRTTGIWQPVWLESVAALHVEGLRWTCDLTRGTATAQVTLNRRADAEVRVRIAHEGTALGEAAVIAAGTRVSVTVPLAGQDNGQGYERLLWKPGSPTLLDAWVSVGAEGRTEDVVASYLGLRSVRVGDGQFLLNDRPVVLRSVLNQGYWPQSHLAAPSERALRREAELIGELGFNAVRLHQKVEDPRFLYHADRLGLLVWGEMAATYSFSDTAVGRTVTEWTEAVRRDASHPSIVTWVPLNESWGVQHLATREDQRAFAEALYHLTKALDPTRPVVSNDGWELGTSDLWTVHDYESDTATLADRYDVPAERLRAYIDGTGPVGRRIRLAGTTDGGEPIMLTEFGGVKWSKGPEADGAWGYSEASSAEDFARRVGDILEPVQRGTIGSGGRRHGLAGWCWTQLTDTRQETNGLLTEDREPKLPIGELRALVLGHGDRT